MIDAHVHLWQLGRHDARWPTPDLGPIYRDFVPADLWRTIATTPVERVLLVQSQESECDTRWLLSLASDDPRILGVVGWTEPVAGDAPARVDALIAAGPLKGLRPMAQDRADDWYDDPALDPLLAHMARRGLVFDALVRPRHLPALARLADRHPDLAIVVDHGAKPAIGADRSAWRDAMAALADRPQVACKLSGLLTEIVGDGDPALAVPVAQELYALFGADRLVWGSDWPVLTLRGDYADWFAMALAAVPAADRAAVFGGNAARLYGCGGAA